MIIRNKYSEYIIIENRINNNTYEKHNIFNYIYHFTKKYSKNFDINLLIQDGKDSLDQIKIICDDLTELFFDFIFDCDSEIKVRENENSEEQDKDKLDDNNDDKDFEYDQNEMTKSKNEIDDKKSDNINIKKKPFYVSIELPKKRKVKTFRLIEAIYLDNKKKSKNKK